MERVVGGQVRRTLWFTPSFKPTNALPIFNILILALVVINLRYSERTILEWFIGMGDLRHLIGLILDVSTVTICAFNICGAIWSGAKRLMVYFTSPKATLTPAQMKLWGINEDDIRFQSTPITTPKSPLRPQSALQFSLSDLSWLFQLTPKKRRSPGSPNAGIASSVSYSWYSSPGSTTTQRRVQFSPDTSTIGNYQLASDRSYGDFDHSLDSIRRRGPHASPMDTEKSPKSILRKPKDYTRGHSTRSEDSFRSGYLYGDHSYAAEWGSPKSIDISDIASQPYQIAQPSTVDSVDMASITPGTPTIATSPGHTMDVTAVILDPIWTRYGLKDADQLEEQSLRLRLWLSATILKPLIAEIDKLNKASKAASGERSCDFVIGESTLLHLQAIAASKFDQYPTLAALLPYLEFSTNQGYLVDRMRELGQHDACLKEFRWDSGGQYKNKPWDDRLPTDSDLIVHLFNTYMNSRLPLHPLCPDGKSFTCQYFVQHPSKPSMERKKGFVCVYQNSITPPNYQLWIDENEIAELEKGKNNLFSMLLLFFRHLSVRNNGYLDSLSLGLSGLNVLWILE